MRIIFVVPIIALIVATKSMAFNTWDFASGENKSVIERIAGARGDTIQLLEGVTVINRYQSNTGTYEIFHLNFCDGHLAAVTKVESFTPANFINTLSELMKLHGTPAISARDETIHSFTDIALKEVQYTWGSLDDRIQLTTNVSTVPSLKLEPGMTLRHEDTTICGFTSQLP